MLFTSPVYSQASGSIAGITYSHNRGGMYTRARVTPTDPSSSRQQTVRAAMGVLAPYWGKTLTGIQRDAWNLYGDNVPWTNALGETIFLTGQQHFLRSNIPHVQLGATPTADAPTIFDLGTFTAPTIHEAKSAPSISIAFTDTDAWANTDGAYLAIYCGKAVGPGRKFYRGPWRLAGAIGGATPPPATPALYAAQWPWSTDNICWVQCRIRQADGRLSLPVILGPETIVP